MMELKRWCTYLTMGCFFLAGGVEYSVIFPTMFDYVKSKDGKEWLYGLCLAAFSTSNLITAPLYGLIFDKTHKTKYIILLANLFEIGGK
jgi:MFS family permease